MNTIKGPTVSFFLLGLLSWASDTEGLKCYTCLSHFECDDPAMVCPDGSKYCVTIKVGGQATYSCSPVCITSATCCQTDGCNAPTDSPPGPTGNNPSPGTNGLKCYMCAPTISTTGCDAPTRCLAGSDSYCLTMQSNGFISHSCSPICPGTSSTSCCQTDGCNAPTISPPGPPGNNPSAGSTGLKCYVCAPLVTTQGCNAPTECPAGSDKYCLTVRTGNKVVLNYCAPACPNLSTTSCCQTDGCNSLKLGSQDSNSHDSAATLAVSSLIISLLLAIELFL